MRRLDTKEKEVLKIINRCNGKSFQEIWKDKLIDVKVIIDTVEEIIRVRYKTAAAYPTNSEKTVIDKISQDLFERIYISVIITKLFQDKWYLNVYQRKPKDIKIYLGDSSLPDIGFFSKIEDPLINKLICEYADKQLMISPELNNFINNGFISRTEKRQANQLKIAFIGIFLSFAIGISSIILNVKSNRKPIKIENQTIIDINRKIDSLNSFLINSLHKKDSTVAITKK